MKNIFSQKGQTMVEMIVAIGVIMMGVFAAVTLTTATISAGQTGESTITAYNLAREGIEVARSVRDGNWLRRERGESLSWDGGLFGAGNDYTAVITFDSATNVWSFDYGPNNFDTCVSNNTCRLYRAADAVYSLKNTGTPTPFYRFLTLNPVCKDGTIVASGSSCTVLNPKVGIEVVSTVRFREKNRFLESRLVERLYNWKVGN